METTTMYDETTDMNGSLEQLKSKMTLDFNGSSKAKKLNNLSSSPDMNICTLGSPELERMIIQQQNGLVTTTPTPTQFLFPKSVTEEQEAYALGFVNALEELKKQETPVENAVMQGGARNMTTLQPVQSIQPQTTAVSVVQSQHLQVPMHSGEYTFTTTTSLPGGPVVTNAAPAPMPTAVSHQQQDMTSSPALMQQSQQQRVLQIKEEPQTVPCYSTQSISPVDMDEQERIRVDRRRARNKVAARKCHHKKQERISRLEVRVREITGQKNELAQNATQLREQVTRLKQQIMEHIQSGCTITLSSNLL